jgi:DNA polymerase I-like protein with 3'-5' exonuclease and polymerase domains
MVSMALPDGASFVWQTDQYPILDWLQKELRQYKGTVIAHHAKFDWLMLKASWCEFDPAIMDCTITRAVLINEHLYDYSLETLLKIYTNMEKLDPNEVGWEEYARQDAIGVLGLWEVQEKEIHEQGIRQIANFERSVFPAICEANARGIRVDLDAAQRAMEDLSPIINEKQIAINKLAGWEFNVNSSPQIKKFFEPWVSNGDWFVGNELIGTAKSGGPSLTAEFLRELSHPMANLIIEQRSLLKTRNTFLAKHILEHAVNDKVYPTINQNRSETGGTVTGRLSYVDPAMQQIPSRNKEVAAIVKSCFLPDEDEIWADYDMASFEVRIFAHLSNNRSIIEAYAKDENLDFHQAVADLTGLVRNATYAGQPNAKQLDLSMIFNQGRGATAKKMGMPWSWDTFITKSGNEVRYMKPGPEAVAIIDQYHRMLPGVKDLADGCKMVAESRGYVHTQHGRRLRFINGRKSYKASGLLIQATSADINKEMWKIIREHGYKLILNTHDSYGLSLPLGVNPREISNELQGSIRQAVPWVRVPLVLELSGAGNNWWDAIKEG